MRAAHALLAALAFLFIARPVAAQVSPTQTAATDLYVRSFGDPALPAIVFVHGGPGYNCASFEVVDAPVLAHDFHVVVYDQRGCGRSPTGTAEAFTFARTIADLDAVIAREGLRKPHLIAHSFGGAIAMRALAAHPDAYGTAILVGAPISYPRSLKNAIALCRARYKAGGDEDSIRWLDLLETLDPGSADYAGYTFQHAMACGLYTPRHTSDDGRAAIKALMASPVMSLVSDLKPEPFLGFIESEKYTTLDLAPLLESEKGRLRAVYGDEDWTLDAETRGLLSKALGDGFVAVAGASHSVFVDEPGKFSASVKALLAPAEMKKQ